ncbi:MAG: 50S ribosomal protein L4 [Candidatus Solincola sediminis]|uniref:Large ribosomal subunit protein uL4 n=1 Tax=Candidatus Solincola sediminis TaxID=1797199 RepID=A0A1F2WHY9_9ACTN|nr:MAG: 50S ribosomal protein L4 [Candidatus Solincola sediminis]OFW59807.1 MAG: 50S ribosomal protein L4 [Candidatus Solincola sediminis]
MKEIKVYDIEGQETGKVALSDYYFASEVNVPVMHMVVRRQLGSARSGTASTKNRSAVRGGGRKPWRQKGTGRARAGSTRSPIWKGGGTVFGPQPRSFGFKVNRKVRKLALRSALSTRAGEDRVMVLEDFSISEPKTKLAASVFQNLGVEDYILLVLPEEDVKVVKSVRNLPYVDVINLSHLNTYDVLANDRVVFTRASLQQLQEGAEDEGSS